MPEFLFPYFCIMIFYYRWILFGFFLTSMIGCKEKSQTITPSSTPNQDSIDLLNDYKHQAEEFESPDRVIWQQPDLVIEQLGNIRNKTIADVGAGTGYFSRRLTYTGAHVIAVDIDPNAISWMESQRELFPPELKERLTIRKATPTDAALKPLEVDDILMVNTYSYVDNRIEYLRNLKKALRPGGSIVIIDFKKKDTPLGPALEKRIDAFDVRSELSEAGFQQITVNEDALDYQYIIKGYIRKLSDK